jgi:hypothetical protein
MHNQANLFRQGSIYTRPRVELHDSNSGGATTEGGARGIPPTIEYFIAAFFDFGENFWLIVFNFEDSFLQYEFSYFSKT